MVEKCPLKQGDFYWIESKAIPEVCRTQCGDLWDKLPQSQAPTETDVISQNCDDQSPCLHDIEAPDWSLQKATESPRRLVGVLNVCMETGSELYAEMYDFDCPNE
jgi:hypothetical protein